jgi:ATP-binding cassette subfamily B protein
MLKKFIKYYKPHRKLLILDITCALLIAVADLVYPMATRNIVNNVIPNKDIPLIFKYGIILTLLYVVRMFFEYLVGYYGHVLGVRMEYDMRVELFSHLQKLSFSFYDNTKTGHIMSRVVNDLFDIAEIAHHGPENLFLSTIKIIGSFILLWSINYKLTLIVFILIPFMFIFMVKYNKKIREIFKSLRESIADINGRVEDSISGIKVVKSFTNEDYETEKFNEGSLTYKNLRSKAVRHIGIFDSGINFLSNMAIVITVTAGGYFVAIGDISYGDLFAFIMYISQFMQPLTMLFRFVEQYQQGMAGFRRFVEALEIEPDIVDKEGAIELENARGEIEYKNVAFSYDNKETILSNINLKVEEGETVAIVGPSGAGKTTLLSLLPRFYEIDQGEITIDGIDIKDITLKSLRKNIGIVQQDVFLFSGTIRENIAYGKLDATKDEIIAAAKAANAHDFISSLPDKYETYIGERGAKLSGGQKQRISIARMFLKNPPVLILDEATSSLDNNSEAIIQKSIEELSKNRTTFIIAHRLATIKKAKRIIVLTENGIEEEGSHKKLIEKKGLYYDLYSSQFGMGFTA